MRRTSFSTVKPLRLCSPGLRRALIKLNLLKPETADSLALQPAEVKLVAAIADFAPGSEDRIIAQLSSELNIEVADLSRRAVIDEVNRSGILDLIESDVLLEHRCVPVRSTEDELFLACADPLDLESIAAIEFIVGKPIRVMIAREASICEAIARTIGMADARVEGADEGLRLASISADSELLVSGLQGEASEEVGSKAAPIVKIVNKILADARSAGASDIHIEPTTQTLEIRIRVDGMLHPHLTIPKKLQPYILTRIKLLSGMDITEKRRPQDGRFRIRTGQGDAVDIRSSTVPTPSGEKIVLRLLATASEERNVGSLSLPECVRQPLMELLKSKDRILLVTGPTGSGKTTTLYALLNQVKEGTTNVITVEDPIEMRIQGVTQIQVDSKIGMTFASGLRSILRQDPDIILVGEIRDLETAEIAFQAAQTGHFVLSTLHTNTAPSAVIRLRDLGLAPFIIASSLGGVLAQRLVRKLCSKCAAPLEPHAAATFSARYHVDASAVRKNVGCGECDGSGYKGRMGVYSFFPVGAEIRELIRNGAGEDELAKAARLHGMQELQAAGLDLALQGLTSPDELERVVGVSEDTPPTAGLPFHVEALSSIQEVGLVQPPGDEPPKVGRVRGRGATQSIASLVADYTKGEAAEAVRTTPRILLVDDDEGVRAVMSRALRKAEFEVIEASNGHEGLDLARSMMPDIVVSDLVMPIVDGREMLFELRKNPQTAPIPVLMLTGSDGEENEILLIEAGANDFVSKASSPPLVIARIRRLLGA